MILDLLSRIASEVKAAFGGYGGTSARSSDFSRRLRAPGRPVAGFKARSRHGERGAGYRYISIPVSTVVEARAKVSVDRAEPVVNGRTVRARGDKDYRLNAVL